MSKYVDCMLAPIKAELKADYIERARAEGALFKKHGAEAIYEGWGDDVPAGETTSMPIAVKLEDGEVVLASWVIWPDKATRERGMATIMEEPLFQDQEMLLDGRRLIFGGFELLLGP